MFCVNVRPGPHSDTHIWAPFFGGEPEDIKSIGLGAICSFGKAAGLS
jgi:hypothetical protein